VQRLYNQRFSNETHQVSYHSMLLEGSWKKKALVGHRFLMYNAMFITSPQNSSSNLCAKIMLLTHSMMILLAHFVTPFCCVE
jgi:hypothetical protein